MIRPTREGSPRLSVLAWFRADRASDDAVHAALSRAAGRLSAAPVRIGHRHDEDRPYRTWMIDAGPVDSTAFEALESELREAFAAEGLPALAQGEPQLERFEWLE